jgi:hypothetical protein
MYRVRAYPPVLSMRPCTLKLDEENSTYAGFAQEKWFFSCIFAEAGIKRSKAAVPLLEKRVINMM